jgi:hypothetical protein
LGHHFPIHVGRNRHRRIVIGLVVLSAVAVSGGITWLLRHGGAAVVLDTADEAADTLNTVEFRVARDLERCIKGVNIDQRFIVRTGTYVASATIMALLWLYLGSQVAA